MLLCWNVELLVVSLFILHGFHLVPFLSAMLSLSSYSHSPSRISRQVSWRSVQVLKSFMDY